MELNQWQLHYPFAEQASLCFEREKKAYIAGLGRDQLEHLASPMTKSETGLEYYSPSIYTHIINMHSAYMQTKTFYFGCD